jgi:hypothetical protein
MLRQGASLSEIGQLLRHRHPSTTMIYAKVDVGALRLLALPWPGGGRPLEPEYVRPPQSSGQREEHDIALMRGEFAQ